MSSAGPQDAPSEELVDEALEESFPASDPPFWTSGWAPHHDEHPVSADPPSSPSRSERGAAA